MKEPTISCETDFTQYETYRLVVPMAWLVTCRYPRLKLWWWLTKLIWKVKT
jgi:hypothetical protein